MQCYSLARETYLVAISDGRQSMGGGYITVPEKSIMGGTEYEANCVVLRLSEVG